MDLKKRPLLLLEILIGLSLAGVVLAILFSFLTQSVRMEKKFDSLHANLQMRQRVQTKLQDLFMTIQAPLYTEKFPEEKQESLVLSSNQGIDPDPAFSGLVKTRLFIDEKDNLCLAIWPTDQEKLWRKEILLTQVEEIEFAFLGKKKKATDSPLYSSFAWHKTWEAEREEIPSQIRLCISRKKEKPLELAFCLPRPEPIVTYPRL